MYIVRSAVDVVAHTPAKLNLFFEVIAKRSDGYHEIETLMCPIGLYDTLYFRETCVAGRTNVNTGDAIELTCDWVASTRGWNGARASDFTLGAAPPPQANLVYRAVSLLRQRAGVEAGAQLRLIKRIPAAAGLGGGSSDAAAALRLANIGWGLRWSDDRLAELAAQLGSDVPFFLGHGAALCCGRGERMVPATGIGGLNFVVARPPEGLSTAAVYRACRVADDPRPSQPMVTALRAKDLRRAGELLFNRLQPASERLCVWVGRLREEFDRCDFAGHAMSGSGSAYFGLCRSADHARRIAARLRARRLGSVYAVASCRM